jgi:serralysin
MERIDCYGSSRTPPGGSYTLISDDANVADDSYMIVQLLEFNSDAADALQFDGSAELGGNLVLISEASGTDALIGGAGNDYLNGGYGGNDVLSGGAGIDMATVSGAVSLLLQGAPQDVGGGRMVTLSGIEDLQGLTADDVFTGDDEANYFLTGGGSDSMFAGGGDDYVLSNDNSNDATALVLDGGGGNDTLSFLYNFQFFPPFTFSLALQGTAQNVDGLRTITATGFENVTGTLAPDLLTGNGKSNVLCGGGADDVLSGAGGDDALYGDGAYIPYADAGGYSRTGFVLVPGNNSHQGNDILYGGIGNDLLDGDLLNDTLVGGKGTDSLIGGTGSDTFVFTGVQDSRPGASARDTLDFSQADGDLIDLGAIDADTGQAGDQAFFLGGGAFTGAAGELIQFDSGGNTVIEGDVDGDGEADFGLELTGGVTVVDADFML